MHRIVQFSVAVLFTIALTSCGSSAASDPDADTGTKSLLTCGTNVDGEITVSAAASLTESFSELGTAFEEQCPGTNVEFTFDSSGTLAQQILDGAPADVFASADEQNMAKLAQADLVEGDPTAFARNQLVIVTQPGNPEGIESVADLADAGVISLCGEDVPCGRFAAEALARAEATIPESSVTRGQNAKATLTAVSEGDAVAGIVYVTDALAAGSAVDAVEITDDQNVVATYPAAALSSSGESDTAAAFVAFLTTDAAQAVFAERGFAPPA